MSAAAAACVMAATAARSLDDYLAEASSICKTVRTIWFTTYVKYDATKRSAVTIYKIYRQGMGKVAERSSPEQLVYYLRKQLPATGVRR